MRIVFMGTPDFAVPSLEALIAAGHEVCGVFSQPDKPVGRHQNKLKPTPVKTCALQHDIGMQFSINEPFGIHSASVLCSFDSAAVIHEDFAQFAG